MGGHAAFGAADGLALSPPFEPCPWRWTMTMVASTRAYSISGSSEQASKSRTKTSALTQSRYRLNTVFQRPNAAGRSRHGLPVRTIHNTASRKSRLSPPLLQVNNFDDRIMCVFVLLMTATRRFSCQVRYTSTARRPTKPLPSPAWPDSGASLGDWPILREWSACGDHTRFSSPGARRVPRRSTSEQSVTPSAARQSGWNPHRLG